MNSKTRIYSLSVLILFLLVGGGFVSAQSSDPGSPGPLSVSREEYNFGDTAFTPTNFPGPVELAASIHYPTGLSRGPYPTIVLLHGRHATCYVGGTALLQWPCTQAGSQSIPSYRGYDY